MSRIFLVRHAQASFFEADYDKLSPLGDRQARLLGEYWAERKVPFDRIYSGPRMRHKGTAEIVRSAFRHSARAFPDCIAQDEFDEYPGEVILQRNLPRLLDQDARIREWHEAYHRSADPSAQRKYFQRVFEAVIERWVAGELPSDGIESWPEFTTRVQCGLSRILAGGRGGERLAVFCSGGPIGVAMQRALDLSPQSTLKTVWMSRNCSFSEFLFSGDRFTLSAFNATPHLDDSLLTYR